MAGIGALFAACLDPAALFEEVKQPLKQAGFGLGVDQTSPEFAQNRGVKAGIGQFKTQQVFPIDATAYGFGGLAVGEVLDKLQDRYQSKPPRCLSRLASCGK